MRNDTAALDNELSGLLAAEVLQFRGREDSQRSLGYAFAIIGRVLRFLRAALFVLGCLWLFFVLLLLTLTITGNLKLPPLLSMSSYLIDSHRRKRVNQMLTRMGASLDTAFRRDETGVGSCYQNERY